MVGLRQEWINAVIETLDKAYVPYSHFPIGARLVMESGKIYQGINIENASLGPTNYTECTAFFKAVSEGEKTFMHLVVVGHAPDPVSPCGACRQVMAGFCPPDTLVTLVGDNGVTKVTTVRILSPHASTEKDL